MERFRGMGPGFRQDDKGRPYSPAVPRAIMFRSRA